MKTQQLILGRLGNDIKWVMLVGWWEGARHFGTRHLGARQLVS
jgi:hypothetical protein